MEEAPNTPLYGIGYGSLEDLVEELEFRIPSLFNGLECPAEHMNLAWYREQGGCSCTYQTGCLALKEKKDKKS